MIAVNCAGPQIMGRHHNKIGNFFKTAGKKCSSRRYAFPRRSVGTRLSLYFFPRSHAPAWERIPYLFHVATTTTFGEVNKIVFIALFLFIMLWGGNASGRGHVTVLIYHKFGEAQYPTTNVSLANFAQQMAYLRDNNYQVLPLAQMDQWLKSSADLPDKAAVITIDDGYESVYSGAWLILRQYGYPFTVFLYTKAVEKKYRNFLTWEQIEEMRAAGVDFQDHSYSHYRMGTKPTGMNDAEYGSWVRDDIEKSRAILERHLGAFPEFLAPPYGEYNSIIIEQVKELGYKAIFSQDPGSVSKDSGYILPREPILGYDWGTIKHFKTVLERCDLPITDIEPDTRPFNGNAAKICATLQYPERYEPGTLNVYVSELGWQRPEVDGKRICLANSKKLRRRTNRIAISAREKDLDCQAIRFWLLINPANDF